MGEKVRRRDGKNEVRKKQKVGRGKGFEVDYKRREGKRHDKRKRKAVQCVVSTAQHDMTGRTYSTATRTYRCSHGPRVHHEGG